MKRKLTIEELDVETFVVAEAAPGRGTVRAHCDPQPIPDTELTCVDCPNTGIQWTCIEDLCQPTFLYSCPGDPEMCGVLAVP
jgi:hypothetical protein